MSLKLKNDASKLFEHTIDTGYSGGKMSKSLAIAYNMKKKMAKGGDVKGVNINERGVHDQDAFSPQGESVAGRWIREKQPEKMHQAEKEKQNARNLDLAKSKHKQNLETLKSMPNPKLQGLAHGGEVDEHDSLKDDLVERIMKRMSPDYSNEARLSHGGEVANDLGEGEAADEMPNEFDDLVLDDNLESDNSGMDDGDDLGDEQEDEDRKDIVSRIMKSDKKKDKLPKVR